MIFESHCSYGRLRWDKWDSIGYDTRNAYIGKTTRKAKGTQRLRSSGWMEHVGHCCAQKALQRRKCQLWQPHPPRHHQRSLKETSGLQAWSHGGANDQASPNWPRKWFERGWGKTRPYETVGPAGDPTPKKTPTQLAGTGNVTRGWMTSVGERGDGDFPFCAVLPPSGQCFWAS